MKVTGKTYIDVNDIVGQVHGKMEIVRYLEKQITRTRNGHRVRHYYECKCQLCGTVYVVERNQTQNMTGYGHKCLAKRKSTRKPKQI